MGLNNNMKKDEKEIYYKYNTIVENENLTNGQMSQASTTFQVDHTAKFLPIGRDMDEEEKKKFKSEILKEKLKNLFSSLKSLIDACDGKKCTSDTVGKLLNLMDNPEARNDLSDLKNALGLEEQDSGRNSGLAR
jgi:hypothetical protein